MLDLSWNNLGKVVLIPYGRSVCSYGYQWVMEIMVYLTEVQMFKDLLTTKSLELLKTVLAMFVLSFGLFFLALFFFAFLCVRDFLFVICGK